MTIDPISVATSAAALKLLGNLLDAFQNLKAEGKAYDELLDTLLDFLFKVCIETKLYLKSKSDDPAIEAHLARLWAEAAIKFRSVDPWLAQRFAAKAHCWTDHSLWEHPLYSRMNIDVDEIMMDIPTVIDQLKSPKKR